MILQIVTKTEEGVQIAVINSLPELYIAMARVTQELWLQVTEEGVIREEILLTF